MNLTFSIVYIYYLISLQLFDADNHLNKHPMKYIFSTEGHILPLKKEFRRKPWEDYGDDDFTFSTPKQDTSRLSLEDVPTVVDARTTNFSNNVRIKDMPIKHCLF